MIERSEGTGNPSTFLFCGHCGGAAGDHPGCRTALLLEPPRYCVRCRRRMVVQVLPAGWTARCAEHGTLTG